MNNWVVGVSIFGMLCTGLAIFIRLSVKSQLSDFLKELDEKLEKHYVRKDMFEERNLETNRRFTAMERGRSH